MIVRSWAATALAVIASMSLSSAQAPRVSFVSPRATDYVSDRVRIEAQVASVDGMSAIAGYTFYVDGREVCRVGNTRPAACEWDAGPVVRAHQFRVVATLADGARLVAALRTRELGVAETTSVRIVQVPVVVRDRSGAFARGLPATAFAVAEDGVPQIIQHFASEEAALELVLAVDVSASMDGALRALKRAVGELVRRLPPRATVSLLAFSDDIYPLGRPSDSLDTRLAILDRLQAVGGTALYDAMLRGLDDLARASGRRALIVFTDGEDQSSRATMAQVRAAVEASDAAVYFVALGRGQEVETLLGNMQELANLSGGQALRADRPAQLSQRFGEVLAELTHQYLIGYAPTNASANGEWRRIDVRLTPSDLKVRARSGYRATVR